MKGRKIGILTSSGSLGVMTADAIYYHEMELACWSQETTEKINHAAPGWVNIKNPLDIGPSGLFALACQTIFGDPNADGFILIPVIPYAAIEGFLQLGVNAKFLFGEWQGFRQEFEGKPVVAVLLGNKEWLNQIRELCGDSIATVNTPEAAAKTLAALHRYSQKYKNDSKPLF